MLGDDLFVSGSRGISPTAWAVELAPRVANALATLTEVLADRPFSPATTNQVIRIGCSDHTGALILPGLVDKVLRLAPGMRLRVHPLGRVDLIEELDEGRLDLVVSWFGPTPERIRRRVLLKEREALVVRSSHPLAGRRPDKVELLAFPHVVVELVGGGESAPGGFFAERGFHCRVWIDQLLLESTQREELERLTAVTVPSFGLVMPILRSAEQDLIATLPLRLAQKVSSTEGLVILDLPYEPIEIEMEIVWHERMERDEALMWLVQQVEAVCTDLEVPSGLSPDRPQS